MKDGHGDKVQIGDKVELWPNQIGRVVCSFEDAQFSPDYPEAEWDYLKTGALIVTEDGIVFHYEQADENFRIVPRAKPANERSTR